ncbi:MAG: InlB B-repeat-containing protein [Bacteroidales bacterium]
MKNFYFTLMLLVFALFSQSQEALNVGSGQLESANNVKEILSGQQQVPQSSEFDSNNYVVIKFKSLPTSQEKEELKKQGIVLHSYISNNMYYATISVNEQLALEERVSKTTISSIQAIDPLWKIAKDVYSQQIPEHAKVAEGIARVNVIVFKTAKFSAVEKNINEKGYRIQHKAAEFFTLTIELPLKDLLDLASQPWVQWIEYVAPPMELDNVQGRNMNRSNILGSNALGQRGLKGKGINVGLWDGSVEAHPDLGNRLNSMEFEYQSEHGQHTSGTILGAGILDPKAMGMAPEATLWAWNFNTQQNGLSAQQEMLMAARDNDVVVTSNSYGVSMNTTYCQTPSTYNSNDNQLDQLVNIFPQLTHVFSAGNDQEKCLATTGSRYATSTKRAKNPIFVGALDKLTGMAWFSSWGPMNDGRILPHITAFGDEVYSTVYNNSYDLMSGTSMACPATSGTITLLYQRYKQIYGDYPIASLAKGAILNTAEDKGNPGPDFQFGYGSLDGLRAVELIEKGNFVTGNIENSQELTHTITVPAGAKELKVMLVWSDYYGTSATKALINDLDITVSKGGTTYLPFILNPSNPSANAVQGVDRLNNQEQVVIKNPSSGEYTIKISGFSVPQGPQEYALVYEYYMPQLMVTHPNGGEKFSPGEQTYVRWTSVGYEGDYTLQLSTNNGQTYQTIASSIPNNQKDYIVTIPNTVTNKALVRVLQNGTMDVSDATFSIMPSTSNLNLVSVDCGGSGWQLTWDAISEAASYKVLKVNVDEGKYYEIGETANLTFDLPDLDKERNIYSVAAVSADGVVSERAYGVIANPSMPLDFATAGIPFEENLEKFPSNYVRVSGASGVDILYKQTLFSYTGAHNILLKGNTSTTAWNATGDLFVNNPNDVASAKICSIDATSITEGQLWIRLAAAMANTGADNARFRLLANGTPITNTLGEIEIAEIGAGKNIMYWNISDKVGTEFSLDFQAVLRDPKDSVQFGHFLIWQPKFDAAITKLNAPVPSKTLTSSETISVDIRNLSGDQLINIPVSYSINGGAPVQEVFAGPIEPLKTATYTFVNKADLSAVDVAFNIQATVSLPGDEREDNNTATVQTTRFGDYYLMPTTTTSNNLTATETPIIFTDNGGKVLNYSNGVNGVVVIAPETTGKKVKIKFTEFNLENNYDKLIIRSGNLSSSPIIATLTGSEIPTDVYSLDKYGNLRVEFISDAENNYSGWVAEVTEVDASAVITDNTFTLDILSHYDGNYSAPTNARITVKNNSTEAVTNVRVRYKINDGEWVNGVIPTIAANASQSFTFDQAFTIPELGTVFMLTAEVVEEDDLMTDNIISRSISSDKYCFSYSSASSWSGGGLFLITKVEKDGISNPTSTAAQGSAKPQYFRSTVLPLYKDVASETITIDVNAHRTGGKVGIWVDWNNDGDYANDGAPYSINTVEGQTSYSIEVPIPNGTDPGQYFVRVRATTHSSLNPCASEYSNNGEVEDYMIEVFETFPISKDVAVTASNLVSGRNLTATESVKVTIKNNASVAVSNFDIALCVDGGVEVVETVTDEIAPFSSIDYIFVATADLSAMGPHEVKIYTLLEGDQHAENDLLMVNIFNEKPAIDGFFALNFDGVNDVVDAGTLGGTNLQSFTYEAWINPASYGGYGGPIGFGRLFEGKAATIFLHGETNTNYPEHCLVISSIGGGTYHTQVNSINLNEWQHVAISFDNSSKALKVYINGIEIPVVTKTAAGTIANNSASKLYIGNSATTERPFVGIIDVARVWSVAKSKADVVSYMHKTAVGQANLIAEFLFDEGYYNSKVYSGSIVASILNADLTNSENSIWVEPTVGFSNFKIESQVIDLEKIGKNHFRTEVLNTADLSNLTATFATDMKGATVKVNGVQQTSGVTSVDFSNSTVLPVEYVVTATYFGKEVSNTYSLEVKQEPSKECELLSINIPLISFSASPVDMDNIVTVTSETAVSALVTNFTISNGAKAYINNTELVSGTAIDYTNPVVIEVIAANGRAIQYYNVSIRKEQIITWVPATLAKTYGDPVFNLEAISTLNQNVSYTSSNPDVISVALNKATVHGVGTVTIIATQPGSNTVVAAAPVEKVFAVSKKTLTITADDKSIEFSDAIPELTMSFNGFANGDDKSVIDELPTISTTAIQNSFAGTYPITLVGGSDVNYDFALVNGELTIIDVAAFDVNFSVTYNSSADQGVNININGVDLTTDAAGLATIKLKAGSYTYLATKVGREEYSGTVTVVDADQPVNIELVDPLPIYTITYTTDGNGSITGTATQSVKQGFDGTEVTATPKLGYNFDKWSDDALTATRNEVNVRSNISAKALFKLKTYTLTYSAGTNGTLTGEAVQVVEHGANGTAVKAIANAGYSFVQWSDGVKNNPRTDVNVMMDRSVTAEYTKVYTLPYTQTFDGTALPEDWMSVDNAATGQIWEFKAQAGGTSKASLAGSSPNAAIIDSDAYGSGGKQNADLISPSFDLTTYSTVNLKFNHYYRHFSTGSASIAYSINGGAWVEIQKWTASTANSVLFDQQIEAVVGQNNVRFKWNFIGSWGYYWLVDDIEITGASAAGQYSVTYKAGENGTLQGVADGIITQVVTAGETGPKVTAVPDAGYAFYQWSDGVTDNPRTDVVIAPIDVTAVFGKDCVPITSLPYLEDFNASTIVPDCWEVPGSTSGGFEWEFGTMEFFGSPFSLGTTGNNAYFNSGVTNFGTEESADLISPTFNFSGYANVYLSFKHFFYSYGSNASTVSYSINGGTTWVAIQSWSADTDDVEFFNQQIAAVAGQSNVKFKWNNTATWDFGWIIDDIEVKAVPSFMLTYSSNDWNFGYIDGLRYQSVDENGSAQEVTAVPYDGYRFVKWDDENASATRTDVNVTANATYTAIFEAITYTLTYTAGEGGTLLGEATQTVEHGTDGAVIEAVANAGYTFVQWSDGSTTNPRTDANVTADVTVAAEFAINTYTLSYTADVNGSITGDASQTVNHGTDGSAVTAVANDGYHFVQWSDGVTANPRTETSVTADLSVTAEFAINTYTLTYTADAAQGSITGDATQTVNHGTDGSAVTAVANDGYHFVKWSDGVTANPRTDANVTADITVAAEFAQDAAPVTFTLTYTAGANGTLTGEVIQTVEEGADGTAVTAVANAGYHFVQWSDGVTIAERTDTEVTADITVAAEFAKDSAPVTYTLTYAVGANGTLTGEAIQTVEEGADGTAVTAVANAGYHFVQWSDGLTANPRTDENVTGDITVAAEFAEDAVSVTYTLTYTAGTNGTLTGEAIQTVEEGADGTAVAAVANAGYHFVKWSDDKTANPRTDANVTADITVVAEFAEDAGSVTYTLTYTAGTNGTLTGEVTQTVEEGANGTAVTAVPAAGYHFVKWSDGLTANPRTDIGVTGDVTVEAEFAEDAVPVTYTLTYTAGANGTLTGEVTQTVEEGANGTAVTAVANAGYHFVKWSDGVETAKRTETNVMANLSVTAEFAEDAVPEYTLTFELVGANQTPVVGATITINEQDLTSNNEGKAEISLANGNYTYTISLEGYEAVTDEVTIIGENQTVKVDMVKLGLEDNMLSDVKVYPNPFTHRLVIANASNVNRIVVTNLIGQPMQVSTQVNANSEWVISTTSLKSGIYIVTLYSTDGKRVVRKVVKE